MGSFSKIDIKREVQLPKKKNENLSEFIGILTGDGYMNNYRKYDYVIEIAGHKNLDEDYLKNYVTDLSQELFNIKPFILYRKDQKTIYLRILSKAIYTYLKEIGFKEGIKGRIKIPLWIYNNTSFMKFFVRGLFDTDGSISLKNKEKKIYPVISIVSKSDLLLRKVSSFLKKQGITFYFCKEKVIKPRYKKPLITFRLQINGYKNLNKWFEIIGSCNQRHISKLDRLEMGARRVELRTFHIAQS